MYIFVKGHIHKLLKRPGVLHLLCWGSYVGFELFALKYFYGKLEPAYVYIYAYGTNIAWFYGLLWNLKTPLVRKSFRIIRYFLRWAALILIFLILKYIAAFLFADHATLNRQLLKPLAFLVTNLYRGSVFAFLALFYYLAGHLADYRRIALEAENAHLASLAEKAELEARLVTSHNAYLQQQLNPHLLFNALNFVYSQVFKHSSRGAKAIELLSDILRYALAEADEDGQKGISLEIQQVNNLIAINRYRYDTPLALHVDIHDDFKPHRIIPLILLTLTENIFKHGNLRDPAYPGLLTIRYAEPGVLSYHSRNLKKAKPDQQRLSRIGLKNIRLRLDYAYPGRYQLAINETADYFELTLELSL
jgi:two-component system LytT family sensor kinase